MIVPLALKRRFLKVGLLSVLLLLTCSLVLYWGLQKWTKPPTGAPSESEITEFSTQLSEQAKNDKEAGQITIRERAKIQHQYPENQPQKNSKRTILEREFLERRREFLERRNEHIKGIKRPQSGQGLADLEGAEEKTEMADRAERDQLGKKKLAEVEDLQGADPHTVIDEVMAALDDPDPDVREEALEALEEIDNEAINVVLAHALADENADVREQAMDVMEKIESPNILPSLERALVDGEESMREAALSILEDIPDPRAVDMLIEKGLLNYNHSISQEAFDSLEFITDQEFESYEEARKWWDAHRDTFTFAP